jgi:hypothetical protein
MSQRLRRERAAIHQKSKWRLAGYIIAGILGTVLLLGVIGLLLILHTTPPPVIHTDPVAAQRLQQQLQEAQTAAASGTQGMVRADETELNSLLKGYFQGRTAKPTNDAFAVVRDMKLSLSEDRLQLYVLANFQGKDITAVIEGKVRTVNGYLDFEPLNGKIGALPIPKSSLKRAMEQMLTTPDGREAARLPKNLLDLHVENGKLVVVFR